MSNERSSASSLTRDEQARLIADVVTRVVQSEWIGSGLRDALVHDEVDRLVGLHFDAAMQRAIDKRMTMLANARARVDELEAEVTVLREQLAVEPFAVGDD